MWPISKVFPKDDIHMHMYLFLPPPNAQSLHLHLQLGAEHSPLGVFLASDLEFLTKRTILSQTSRTVILCCMVSNVYCLFLYVLLGFLLLPLLPMLVYCLPLVAAISLYAVT